MSRYSTAKSCLLGMVRSMAFDLAPYKVRVNAVSPGVIETELFFETLRKEADLEAMLAKRRAMHPIGRTGRPEEIAAVVSRGKSLRPAAASTRRTRKQTTGAWRLRFRCDIDKAFRRHRELS